MRIAANLDSDKKRFSDHGHEPIEGALEERFHGGIVLKRGKQIKHGIVRTARARGNRAFRGSHDRGKGTKVRKLSGSQPGDELSIQFDTSVPNVVRFRYLNVPEGNFSVCIIPSNTNPVSLS